MSKLLENMKKLYGKVEKNKEQKIENHRWTINHKTFQQLKYFNIKCVFYSLTNRQTGKIYIEWMLVDQMNIHKKSGLYLNSC